MNDNEKQAIDEMAKYIYSNGITYDTAFHEDCRSIARDLYCAGYRKQSENVIELPCKIGDTVYIIDECGDGECSEDYVLEVKVRQFFINKNGIMVDLELPLGLRLNTWMMVGKNVFLTEEEAETALAKMKGGE